MAMTPASRSARSAGPGVSKGVSAAATGAIAGAAYVLAMRALVDGWTIAIAVVTFAALARWKVSELWLIGAAGVFGLLVRS